MAGELKTIKLEYGTNKFLSEAEYNNLTTAAKGNYQTYVTGIFSNANNANARLIVTQETYIPISLTISENVTLCFKGGLITSPANIKLTGQNTRINANFEQIFGEKIQFAGIWDVRTTHPEWFGDTSMENDTTPRDCSAMIQKAIDLAYIKDRQGGKVVCRSYGKYALSKCIFLPVGVSFDGGNSDFFPKGTSANLYGGFMFRINDVKGNGNTYNKIAMRGQWDVYSNIRLINFPLINNANHYNYGNNHTNVIKTGLRGIYCASQFCSFENIHAEGLWQTFQRSSDSSDYLDQISIRNVVSAWCRMDSSNNRYQIDMGYIGDNLLVDNIHTYIDHNDYPSGTKTWGSNDKHLRVTACGGGVIQRVINGSIYIAHSKGLVVQGVHQEFGFFTIENSQVEINGVCHFKKPEQPAFLIQARASTGEHRIVSIKNTMIQYYHDTDNFSNSNEADMNDIKLNSASAIVKIENVVRSIRTNSTEVSSLYGIRINHEGFMSNAAGHSLESTIIGSGSNQLVLNKFTVFQPSVFSHVLEPSAYQPFLAPAFSKQGGASVAKETYHYKASLLFDKERRLGRNLITVQTITVNESGKMVGITLRGYNYTGCIIRLFRWTGSSSTMPDGNVISYIDVPICSSSNLFYDLGNVALFGEKWVTSQSYSSISLHSCDAYQCSGDNVTITTPTLPTAANSWVTGDTVRVTPSSGQGACYYFDNGTFRKVTMS